MDAKGKSRPQFAPVQDPTSLSQNEQDSFRIPTSSNPLSPILPLLTAPFQAIFLLVLTHTIHYLVLCVGDLYESTSGRRARSKFQVAAGFPWMRIGIGLVMMVVWHGVLGRLVVTAWGRGGFLRGP